MSTTDSPINQLHALWTTNPTNYENQFFKELGRAITAVVATITEKPADDPDSQDAVSGVLLHLLKTPRGKTRSRLDDCEPQKSFFNFVWEVTKNYLDDSRNKKTLHLVQVADKSKLDDEGELEQETELEKQHHQFVKNNPPAPKLSADCIEDAVTRNIAEEILAGAKVNAASEAAGLTANAGQKRLRKLGESLTPEMLAEAYERSAEARAIQEWRPTLKIAGFIERNDPRLEAGYRLKMAA